MKKLAIIAAALTLVGASAFAQTNQVLSRNAVGYVRVDAPAGKFNLVRLDFVNLSGTGYTVTNLIGNQLAQGSAVYIWDLTNQTYRIENKAARGWSPGTNVIRRGAGLFIQSSSNAQVFLMGEVPDQFTAPTSGVYGLTGYNLVGVPYPVDTAITTTPFYLGAAQGDAIYLWNTDQTYAIFNRAARGWSPPDITNRVLKPGQGMWYQRSGAAANTNWVFGKPYTWP